MRTAIDNAGARKADLAAIHIAKAALGWSDDEYRDVMWSVCRVRSAGAMDFATRKRFLSHLQRSMQAAGIAPRAGKVAAKKRQPLTAPQGKMWSLWQQLYEGGKTSDRSMAGLLAFSQRQTGVHRLEWLNSAQEDLVIESLKRWLARR